MKARLEGQITAPVVAILGVWDPFLPAHRQLFADLCCYARRQMRSSLLMVIDPAPSRFLQGAAEWPVYDDHQTLLHLIRPAGFDGILHLRFCKADLQGTASDLFNLVLPLVKLDEFWLGANQSLGQGEGGNHRTVARLAEQHGIQLRRLPEIGVDRLGKDIRRLLKAGCIAEAAALAGRPPVRSRPKSGVLRFAWPSGPYRIVALESPDASLDGYTREVCLQPDPRGGTHLDWPDRSMRYIAFVAGPSDRAREH